MGVVQFFQLVCVYKIFKSKKLREKIIDAPNAYHVHAVLFYIAIDDTRQMEENIFKPTWFGQVCHHFLCKEYKYFCTSTQLMTLGCYVL